MGLSQRHQRYTEREFAALVKVSDRRLELWDGQILDMSYASPTHRDIVRNLVEVLGKKLKPPGAPYTSEPIRPAKTTGVFREPDLVVLRLARSACRRRSHWLCVTSIAGSRSSEQAQPPRVALQNPPGKTPRADFRPQARLRLNIATRCFVLSHFANAIWYNAGL